MSAKQNKVKPITFAELMKEVAKYERRSAHKFIPTKEQIKFVSEARKKNMEWSKIMEYWRAMNWPKLSASAIRINIIEGGRKK